MELGLALVGGLALGLALGLLRSLRRRPPPGIGEGQLLRWIEDAPQGWLILNGTDEVELLNGRAEKLLQISGASMLRQRPLWQLCDAPELAELIRNARQRQRSQRLVLELAHGELEALALPGEHGWLAVLLQSRRSLEAQLEQQERWVGDVAHELRTPLTALLLVGESLSARVTSANAVLVERLQRELVRLQKLVEDLLELSRLENTMPGEGLRLAPVDPTPLVEQVWAVLRPLAEQRAIRLELVHEVPGRQGLLVLAEASKLHRALLNLIDNAVRYSPEGGTVKVSINRNGSWCLISVRDQGPGLSEGDLEHLFERFYRGDPSRVRSRRGGSGLGLAIVQQIVATHGGRVHGENIASGGARFDLLLPMAAQAEPSGMGSRN